MNWLDTPVGIVPALNRLTEVIIERYNYMMPAKNTEGTGFEFIPLPATASQVKNKISYIKLHIATLYAMHFPVKNFGIWSGNWRPFDKLEYDSEEVQNGITAELTSAGIDPAGFWQTPPHLISDGNFVRACYHLLNNVILYSVYGLGVQNCQSRLLKWSSESAYDNDRPSVDETVDYGEGGLPGCAVYGKYKEYLRCEFNRRFAQNAFDTWDNQMSQELHGNWKGRYSTRIHKQLTRPLLSGTQAQEYDHTISGVTEISFTGTASDTTLPWHDDISRDLEYYKTWGDYKYYHSMLRQVDTLTEVLLNEGNFPPPNYKYLD
ncbi:MAG: hypothetical protein E7054_02890 [Lentisphaerae bacterium]|nr:hypothetical protein [Lentisphaerota bacterium]